MAVLRIVALAAVVALSFGCAGRDVRGPFNNQYVDAETGKPIEGVVFLVVWNSLTPNLVDGGGQKFYEAREAVSGPDGRVEIPALRIWRPGVELEFHEFARDYDIQRVQITPPDGSSYVDPTVTSLRLLRTREEQCAVAARARLPSAPDAEMPLFSGIVHQQRELCRRATQ